MKGLWQHETFVETVVKRSPPASLPSVRNDAEFCVFCGDRRVRVRLVRNPRARRYILRLQPDGTARVTVPRGGTLKYARAFAQAHRDWLEKQLRRPRPGPSAAGPWRPGRLIFFRGEEHRLTLEPHPTRVAWLIRFATQTIELPRAHAAGPQSPRPAGEKAGVPEEIPDLRPPVRAHLRQLAQAELPPLTRAWAERCGLVVRRVTIRDQRTRWGSCSGQGNISLNWRLVMMPPWVRDYVILHELMHLREANHSERFWREVAAVCPDYPAARAWIRRHGPQLH
jgi:predicted metal-dependent hydrolase